jgi:4-hydroxybenzoate polyprenyltransferase
MSHDSQNQVKGASVLYNIWIALSALRLHHWLKNCLLFVPPIITHAVSSSNLLNLCVGFVAFGCASSANYLMNDRLDKEHDRQDSAKRKRPHAAGHLWDLGCRRAFSWLLSLICLFA